ncbi:hypothetical protein [Nocardiopsis halotolerans]|uniref:hypothetical protein n=1 Tax=Nocardiopsis halotolerans TaxID=124252 RepID=UPI0003449D6C|nr:hypothetical protein [Nocardiopsis halotolerans]
MGFGVPYLAGTLLLSYVSAAWAFVWAGLYFAVLFGWAAWERRRRSRRSRGPTPPTGEKHVP